MRTEQSDCRTGIENWATNRTSSKASSDIFNDRDHPYLFKTWFGQTRPPALLPYPVIALMLAACGGGGGGGGGSAPVTSGNNTAATSNNTPNNSNNAAANIRKTIWVYDPPVGGAPIFVDVNGNLQVDNGDLRLRGVTDRTGKITVEIPAKFKNKPLLADLRDKANLQHEGLLTTDVWAAPANSNVISVITTLLVHGGAEPEEMTKLLHSVSAQMRGFDPFRHNPYGPNQASYDTEFIKALLPHLERSLATLKEFVNQSSANTNQSGGNDEVSTAEPPKTPKETVKDVLKSEVEQLVNRSNAKQAKEREEATETPPPQNQPIEQPAREDTPAPQVPQSPPTQPTAPTAPPSGQSPNKAPKIIYFQASQFWLYETDGTESPQTIEDQFFIRDDHTEIDPSQHITVERSVANNEWRVDDRFAVRPIDSTERTDDFRLRTRKKEAFDREHADDFESLEYAQNGWFWLRIKVDDGEGGITYAKTLFEMLKQPVKSGGVKLHKKGDVAGQQNDFFDTNTVFKVTSTYEYPDNHQIDITRHVTYQKANPNTGFAYPFEPKHKVDNPDAFTISEVGVYLVTIQLKNEWSYGASKIVTNFGRPKKYLLEVIKPAEQSSSSSAGSTSPAAFDFEPVPDVDPVLTGAEII